jgi:hypothetical protein
MPAEIISLNSFALDGSMLGVDLVSPSGSIPLALQDVFPRLVHEHPLHANSVRLKYQDFKTPVRLSDVIEPGNFRRLALFHEFFKPIGVDRQLIVTVRNAASLTLVALNRKSRDFSLQEKDRLAELQIFLQRTAEVANAVAALERAAAQSESIIAAVGIGVVHLDRNHRVQFCDPLARTLISRYFPGFRTSRLPDQIATWLGRKSPSPLNVSIPDATLQVRYFRAEGMIALLLEEFRLNEDDTSELVSLGVTPQEARVLFGVGSGESRNDIARRLQISKRTVDTHMQNIYTKLRALPAAQLDALHDNFRNMNRSLAGSIALSVLNRVRRSPDVNQ